MAGSTPASLTADARAAREGLAPQVSPALDAWRRFRRHRLAVASTVILLAMTLAVAFGPALWPVSINDIDFTARLQPPTPAHPLGTDDLGRDFLARMLYGGRISLAVGFAAMVVSLIVGTLVGAVAGISRGSIDAALMWLTDLFLSLPQLPLLLVIIYLFRDSLKAVVGPEGGVFILVVAVIGGFRWMPVARLVRAQFLSLREKEFVEAARARRLDHAAGHAPHPAERAGPRDRGGHDQRRRRHHRGNPRSPSSASAFRRTSRHGGGSCSTPRTIST